jgi:hypothetical protein
LHRLSTLPGRLFTKIPFLSAAFAQVPLTLRPPTFLREFNR